LALTAAQYLVSKGTAIMNSGYFSKARPHIEECYLIRKKFLYGDPLTADTLYILADLYKQSGELKLAESTLKSALESQVLIFGMLCEQSALCVHSQAEIKRAMGNFFEAETLFTENFARRVEVLGNVGSALLGNALINLSIGKFTEATDMAEKSYTMRMKKHKGMKHVEVLESILCKAKIQVKYIVF
jgi:tetratricopeptide (TPR) repeat protein